MVNETSSPNASLPAPSDRLKPSISGTKFYSTVFCGAALACAFSNYAIGYIGGRLGNPLSISMLPAQIVPSLVLLLSVIALLVIFIVALVQKQNRRPALIALVLSMLFPLSGLIIPSSYFFKIGFRHKITATVSPDELRQIARVSSGALPLDDKLPGPGKASLWDEAKHRAPWTALARSTSLGKLDSCLVIFNYADEVEIVWGGALVGHWGVTIEKSGHGSGDIAPDITTFVSH